MKINISCVGSLLILFTLVTGCTTPLPQPIPAPRLNPGLLEGQTSIVGIGVPQGTINVLVNGRSVGRGTVAKDGAFTIDVVGLETGQIVTATQTITGRTSAPSLPIIVEKASLTKIEISPALPTTIEPDQIVSFTAKGLLSNGLIEDPLSRVTWSTQNLAVASVDANGMVRGLRPGTTTIQANRDTTQSSPTRVSVKPPPPMITTELKAGDRRIGGKAKPSANIKIMINEIPLKLRITADAQGRWETPELASLIEGDQITSTQLVNHIQSSSSSTIRVAPATLEQIAIRPTPSAAVQQGQTLVFTASGTFSNGRKENPISGVSWSIDNHEVAVVERDGFLTGIRPGSTTLHATRESVTSSPVMITVKPQTPIVTSSLKAGDVIITGKASPLADIQVLLNGKVSGERVKANAEGDWSVQTSLALAEHDEVRSTQFVNNIESLRSDPVLVGPPVLTQIVLHPESLTTIDVKQSQRFTASGTYSDGQIVEPLADVQWVSANPNIATIDVEGIAQGIEAGTTTIQATHGGLQSSRAIIAVKPPPPVVSSHLKAGDTIVAGSASSSAEIQVLMNGMKLDTSVLANSEGSWQIGNLPSLNENDQLTATQIINKVESDPAEIVKVRPNNPPMLRPIGNQTVTVGETLNLTLDASDPEGHEVFFEVSDQPLPDNSLLNSHTGLFTFTPSKNQVGESRLTFLASDGYASQEETVTVKVILPTSLVVLLENPDGTVGKIQVANTVESQTLNTAGQAIGLGGPNEPFPEPFILKSEDIQETFKDVLQANPEEPITYILYFKADTKLSLDSEQQLPKIISIINARTAPDVSIIGHSDRTGSVEYNNQLSLRRATSVQEIFVAKGINTLIMNVTSHGENDPIVETPDGVSEPLNRRVEIIIR